MDYIHEVARINTIRNYKIIPWVRIEEVRGNSNALVDLLREYKYTKIGTATDKDLLYFENFDSIVSYEIEETIGLLNKFFKKEHRWLTDWFRYIFFDKEKVVDSNQNLGTVKSRKNFLEWCKTKVSKLKSAILDDFFVSLIDFENVRIYVSYLNSGVDLGEITPFFLSGGKILPQSLVSIFPDKESFKKEVQTKYPNIKLELNERKGFYSFQNEVILNFVNRAKVKFYGVEPLIAYFFEKLLEVRNIKSCFLESYS